MHMKKHTWILVLILSLAAILIFLISLSDRKMNNTEQFLLNEIKNGKAPSVQYYLFNEDSIIKSFQFGYANIEKKNKIDINYTYNAFSITKTFTALAVLQLAEKNKININDPVNKYLGDFPYGPEITIKQILNHAAGLPNPIPLSWIHLDIEHETFDSHKFFTTIIEDNNKVKSKPNEKYAYSNIGYVILGRLIETVTGEKYEIYIANNIINKLLLNKGDLSFEIFNQNNHATGYHKRMSVSNLFLGILIDKSKFMNKTEGKWKPFEYFHVNGAPYGGLIGKPIAFVKYVQDLLNDSSKVISNDYKKMLFEENITNDGKSTGMCLSWFKGQLSGYEYFAHAGGGGGYYCEIRIYPELKIGSVIFFNRSGMSDERFLNKLDIEYIQCF